MYLRVKRVRQGERIYEYLQLVEGRREGGKVRQRVVATLGRLDQLKASGQLDRLAASFAHHDPPPLAGVRQVGGLALVVPLLRRLGLREVVDRVAPVRSTARLTHGQVIEALVANRLTAPAPLYDVAGWAGTWATEELLRIPPNTLNDDRLGGALDQVAAHAEELTGVVALRAIEAFGLETTTFAWDLTHLVFEGAYRNQHPQGAEITYGYAPDRARRHQVQLSVAATSDGTIPLYHQTASGKAAMRSLAPATIEALANLARAPSFLLVADSAMVNPRNLLDLCQAGIFFISALPRTFGWAKLAEALPAQAFAPLGYLSARQAKLPEELRHGFWGAEASFEVTDRKRRQVLRMLVVRSSEEAEAAHHHRARQLERAEGDLAALRRAVAAHRHRSAESVERRLAKVLQSYRVAPLYRWEVGMGEDGWPTLSVEVDPLALRRAQAADGLSALISNLSSEEASATQVLTRYKERGNLERRFAELKGPLVVRPVFLKSNRRVVGLVFVVMCALLLFALLEREARRATGGQPLSGLLGEGRPGIPTARSLLEAFTGYGAALRRGKGGLRAEVQPPNPLQEQIFALLGISAPRFD